MRRWKQKCLECFSDAGLVDSWLDMHRKNWFENRENGLYGYELRARALAEYWLAQGEHGPDYNDNNLIYLQKMWREYLEMFECEEEEK
jgi:hypothetical protein